MTFYSPASELKLSVAFANGDTPTVRFRDLPAARLAAALVQTLDSLCNSGGGIKSEGTLSSYACAVRAFCRWVGRNGADPDLSELTRSDVTVYFRTVAAHRHIGHVAILLKRANELAPGSVDAEVLLFVGSFNRSAAWGPARHDGTPVRPLTDGEVRQLVPACRSAIAATEARLRDGRKLASTCDVVSWSGRVLHVLEEHGPMKRACMLEHLGITTDQFKDASMREGTTMTQLAGLLFPRVYDLIPYMLLLGLGTGITPESLGGLAADCMEDAGPKEVRIRWTKYRGGGEEADVYSKLSRESPGRLIHRVLTITAHARQFASRDDQRHLWIAHLAGRRGGKVGAVHRPSHWQNGVDAIKRFLDAHDIRDDSGERLALDRRMLRQTAYTRLQGMTAGDIAAMAGINQSQRAAADHYTDATEAAPGVVEAILDAQHELVDRARRRFPGTIQKEPDATVAPTVIDADEDPQPAAGAVRTFMATCRSFRDSPFAPRGEPCSAPPWACLTCGHCVVGPSHLPMLLAFEEFLEEERKGLDPVQWISVYGDTHRMLVEEVLPEFSRQQLKAAQAHAEAAGIVLTTVLELPR
jgi:hypothetical protein